MKKVRLQKSRIKTFFNVLYDYKGLVHKSFVPEGHKINSDLLFELPLYNKIHPIQLKN